VLATLVPELGARERDCSGDIESCKQLLSMIAFVGFG
jgi:hypothetical protein